MARTIAPGNPTAIQPAKTDIPDIDLSVFDKLGDAKVKSAMQNFKLYAGAVTTAESQKLYNQYQNNPLALAQALEKLPEMLSDLPQSVQDEFKPKMQTTAFTLVSKAQANREKAIEQQNKLAASAIATSIDAQMSDAFFNVLRYYDAPEEDKRKLDLDIYQGLRNQLGELANTVDAEGNPLFNESQRMKMFMPKDAIVKGAKAYINRMEDKQLQDWDKRVFQNRTKFMQDTGIGDDEYDSIEQYLTKRQQALKNTKERQIHGTAYYEQLNLIDEPTKVNIEKVKSYPWVDGKLIDKAVKSAQEITQAKYYDPMRRTAPDAFISSLNLFGDALNNNDWSVEGREHVVAQMFQALGKLEDFSKQTNMSPEMTNNLTQMIKKAAIDPESNQVLVDSGVLNIRDLSNPVLAGMRYGTNIIEQAGESYNKYKIVEPDLGDFTIHDAVSPTDRMLARMGALRSQLKGAEAAKATAIENFSMNLERAVPYYLSGDYDNYKLAVANAYKKKAMDEASYIVKDGYEWERLIREYNEGKKPIYNYMGRMLEFKGINNGIATFDEIF